MHCDSVKPQCAIGPISHCRSLMYDRPPSFECEQDDFWNRETRSEWGAIGEAAKRGKWMSNAPVMLLSGQQWMSVVVLGRSLAWIYWLAWMWSRVLLKKSMHTQQKAAPDKKKIKDQKLLSSHEILSFQNRNLLIGHSVTQQTASVILRQPLSYFQRLNDCKEGFEF